ncbi:MAG: 2Fe-2S iron-sulfur cluster-binding protein, partial [Dehalococcoidia bacterium]
MTQVQKDHVGKVAVSCELNGQPAEFLAAPYQSLLEVLREVVGLTGTKEGCNDGNCGACTVSLDGRIVNSCLVLAPEVEGKRVDTIEGMASP